MSENGERPIPEIYPEAAEFWAGTRQEELRVPHCDDCGETFFPPRIVCPRCSSNGISWSVTSGKGEVYSYTVIHHSSEEYWQDQLPYVNCLVHLYDKDVYLFSTVENCDPEDLHIGMAVEAIYEPLTDAITLPKFQPKNDD